MKAPPHFRMFNSRGKGFLLGISNALFSMDEKNQLLEQRRLM